MMNPRGIIFLMFGDLIAYIFSLVLTLALRYGEIPGRNLLIQHLSSFSILFILFLLINFIAGLYDKQPATVRGKIQSLLFKVQIVNFIFGITFFYFAPVGIAPKANLFIYFVISTFCFFLWRSVMFPVFSAQRKQVAVLIGCGEDIDDLKVEINGSARYGLSFKEHIKPDSSVEIVVDMISASVKRLGASIIVADLHDKTVESAMNYLYSLIFSGVIVLDAARLYETVFDRIPLSMVGERWLVEHAGTALQNRRVYDVLKRVMDIIAACILGFISLILYPFIYIAIKMEDKGSIFISQQRVGRNGKLIRILKFRSMTANDGGVYGKNGRSQNRITRVGRFLRLTRMDELPQLWSVLKGEQSLIGPRPELPALAVVYEKEIPYYNVRHLIKPGLSGWAQIYHRTHPHHLVAIEDTKDKLSYDLYYAKNRSLTLDIRIALQTAKSILSKQGV